MTRALLLVALLCGSVVLIAQVGLIDDPYRKCLSQSIEMSEQFWHQNEQMVGLYCMLKECMGKPIDTTFVNNQLELRRQGLALIAEQKALLERLAGR